MTSFEDVGFGSSGIRGGFGDEITPELALRLGRSAANLAETVVVGRDARTTGSTLEDALVAGLTAGGASVTRLGIAPTPTVAHAAGEHDLGVMITASHNPAPDNGFKLFSPNGASLGANGRQRILAGLQTPPALETWDSVGPSRRDTRPVDAYVDAVLEASGPLEARPRIVVDPGNGAASDVSPRILRQAGASVLTINAVPDGTFPGRPSEPTPENLADLSAVTGATDAILGVGHDGDGDRVAIVDENGRLLKGDQVIVLLARALHAGSIAVPVDTSRLVWDALPDVDVDVTPVGDAYVSEHLTQSRGELGGEPSGGMILPQVSLCPDGPHAALVIARLAARHGGLADLVDELPTYATLRENVDCPEASKQPAMARVQAGLADFGETRVHDGVRLDTDEGWGLVRPSGTEEKLRVTVEAPDDAAAERLLGLVRGVVDEAMYEVVHGG